jgi:hypothetical protein
VYYPDLSPYEYLRSTKEKALNVGWLDRRRSFPTGKVESVLLLKLGHLCKTRVNGMRGFHVCDCCEVSSDVNASWEWFLSAKIVVDGVAVSLGSAEIRVHGMDGTVYAAPNLIYHYIAKHDYLPPEEFLHALRNTENL